MTRPLYPISEGPTWFGYEIERFATEMASGVFGAFLGFISAVGLVYWQTRETARHDLRAVTLSFLTAISDGKGGFGENVCNPWADRAYRDRMLACFFRYRSLCGIWKRKRLDAGFSRLCGVQPPQFPRRCLALKDDEPSRQKVEAFLKVV